MEGTISVGGSDTSTSHDRAKRVGLIARWEEMKRTRLLSTGCGAGEYVEHLLAAGTDAHGMELMEDKVRQ